MERGAEGAWFSMENMMRTGGQEGPPSPWAKGGGAELVEVLQKEAGNQPSEKAASGESEGVALNNREPSADVCRGEATALAGVRVDQLNNNNKNNRASSEKPVQNVSASEACLGGDSPEPDIVKRVVDDLARGPMKKIEEGVAPKYMKTFQSCVLEFDKRGQPMAPNYYLPVMRPPSPLPCRPPAFLCSHDLSCADHMNLRPAPSCVACVGRRVKGR